MLHKENNDEEEIMMKNIYLLLITTIILCTNCVKSTSNITQNNTDNSVSTSNLFSADTDDMVNLQTSEEKTKSLKEIIEDYPLTLPPEIDHKARWLACQIEGNFTNSGNREIIGFYKPVSFSENIDAAFCFVCTSSGEKVEKIFYIDRFLTGLPTEKDETVSGLTETLGRPIIWDDRTIGYVSDFNGNGKDELYLYSLTGRNRQPLFFEFDETEFVYILDTSDWNMNIYIDSVDVDKKIINIHEEATVDSVPYLHIEERSYMWDSETRRYELIPDSSIYYYEDRPSIWNNKTQRYEYDPDAEVKRYFWNADTRKYEGMVE